MAANLTSPTNEFATKERSNSGDDTIEKKEDKGGSIVGLRSTKYGTKLDKKNSPSPEAKPRSNVSNEDSTSKPKPKPLPKPRPWSIVGVDRKSGEVTSVTNNDNNQNKTAVAAASGGGEKPKGASVRDLINNMNKEATTSDVKRKVSSLPRGSQPPDSSANSPKLSKKTDSASDDPRILKLEDDYAYEGVMDV